MDMSNPDTRPVYLNLLKIRQPVTALLSIGHRISGIVLFLVLPVALFLLEYSLKGPEEYAAVVRLFGSPAGVFAGLVLGWMLLLHLFAGVRFLLIDMDWGVELRTARQSASMALWAASGVTLILALFYLW